jgi:hypothetical protein
LAVLASGHARAAVSPDAAAPGAQAVGPPPTDAPPMAFVGLAGAPCSAYVRAVEAERRARPPGDPGPDTATTREYGAFLSWADGYLTARNQDEEVDRLAGQASSHEQRARWLELFCRANPDARFWAAAYGLREWLIGTGQ